MCSTLALRRGDLVAAALAATPARGEGEQLNPAEVIPFGELAGHLAKSDWGLAREQSELLIAALLRAGHLTALDAFLQPLRFEVVAAPLSDFLPYVTRARPLGGAAAEQARALWSAVTGEVPRPFGPGSQSARRADSGTVGEWDLPAQERVWRELLTWAGRSLASVAQRRAEVAQAAEVFGHGAEAWEWAEGARSRAEAVARGVDGGLASREGLQKLAEEVARLPGGTAASCRALCQWRECEAFLDREFGELAARYRLLTDARATCLEGSLLARSREEAVRAFAAPERLVREGGEVRAQAAGWLETYRRHYLAWHERVHAAARFQELAKLRQSAVLEAMRRLARAGLEAEESGRIEAEVGGALGRRCLVGDPLPAGQVVCPQCGLRLGEEIALPEVEEVARRGEEVLARQREALRGQGEMLARRLASCADERVRKAGAQLSAPTGEEEGPGAWPCAPTEVATGEWARPVVPLLTDEVIVWIQRQLDQPRAARRSVGELAGKLVGREVPKSEVRRAVEEWLGGEEDMVEVVP